MAPVDQYLVCGENYQSIRNAVANGVMEARVDKLDETCEVMLHLFVGSYLISDHARSTYAYMSIISRLINVMSHQESYTFISSVHATTCM